MKKKYICIKKDYAILKTKSQTGSVLIISLVILLVMTLVGISNIRSSGFQIKMANNVNTRQTVFQNADTALSLIEKNFTGTFSYPDNDYKDCADNDDTCYDANCAGGKCFSGSYVSSDARADCAMSKVTSATAGAANVEPYWMRASLDVWNDTDKHETVEILNSAYPDVKYIAEFMCYIDTLDSPARDCVTNPASDCSIVFRITALSESPDERVKVMLQSTVAIPVS